MVKFGLEKPKDIRNPDVQKAFSPFEHQGFN
jgi:hypothetical protein